MKRPLTRTTAPAVGIPAASVEGMLDYWREKNITVHSFMLLRHGRVAVEGWFAPFTPEKPHMLFSLSKSFTSAACAFAFEEGLFSPEDHVTSFFPEYEAGACENLRKMRVKHLLSMCTGHEPSADFIFNSDDCVGAFMTSDVPKEPGTFFSYNTGATYMLSAILQKVSGVTVLDYLTPRLFEPLGIEDAYWESCPKGINMGGFGLNIRTEDIAKFGQFLLLRGKWDGVQLLSEKAVDEMTRKRINNCGDVCPYKCLDDDAHFFVPEKGTDAAGSDWAYGYGRQFWRCAPDNVYRGDGMDGQYCIVMPDQDMVIAITAGTNDMQSILTGIWKNILPASDSEFCSDDGTAELKERTDSLALDMPRGSFSKPDSLPCEVTVKSGDGGENNDISFRFGDTVEVLLDGWYTVGEGEWIESRTDAPDSEIFTHASLAGAWTAPNVYTFANIFDRTPFAFTMEVVFGGDGADITVTKQPDGTVTKAYGKYE